MTPHLHLLRHSIEEAKRRQEDYYDRKLRCYGPLMVLIVCLTFWVIVIIAVMAAGKALL